MNRLLWNIIPSLSSIDVLKAKFTNSHKIYPSYQDAYKSCNSNAYEEDELIEVIQKKTQIFAKNTNQTTLAIAESTAYTLMSMINPLVNKDVRTINVLDFGGACGAHYYHLRNVADKNLKLNWVVVETPTMVKYAKSLENEELSFFDNFEQALSKLGEVDLLHTSGTLQCVNNPDYYLDLVLKCNAKWLLMNRLGLNQLDHDVITVHHSKLSWNGAGQLPEGHKDRWIKYPFNFISERKFLSKLHVNYQPIASFNEQSGMYPIRGQKIVGYGLLCKHKALNSTSQNTSITSNLHAAVHL